MSRYYGVLFIIVLVAVSGAIAYVGDIVGRRMGRKRLSLFGLRPRHTAIVISVIAGMLITVVTLAVAMALSENVRIGFISVGKLRTETRELRAQQGQLKREAESLAARVKSGQKALTETRARLTRELKDTEAKLAAEKVKLQKAQETRQRAEQAAGRLGKEVQQLRDEKRRLDQQTKELRNDRELYALALAGAARERVEAVIFDAGQPLAVEGVAPSNSAFTIRRKLDGFLARLDAAVRKAGAKPEEGTKQAVVIRHWEQDPKTKRPVLASRNQVLDGLAASIRDQFRENPKLAGIVVQASCVRNAYPGEPVYVDFVMFPNVLVFRKGTQLAEVTVPAEASRGKVGELLSVLLKGRVRAVSDKRVVAQLDPSVPHSGAQSANVGSGITWEEVFDVADQVGRVNGPARIRAVAKDDTWTIGPLNVDLRVEPAG